MSDKSYNGWTNYETWNVALWLDSEEGSYGFWHEQADEVMKRADGDKDEATSELADQIQSEIRENAPDCGASCYSDLLNAALGEVNWYEIAGHYVDAAKERWDEEHAEENEADKA